MSQQSTPTLSIPIFLASDENYASFLCTTMYSILQNTKHTIKFYVLDGGILDKTKQQIAYSLKCFSNYSIDYTDMSCFALDRFPNIPRFSANTFSRYFIPQIQPQVNKAIYLDVDIIVECDIAELYNQDLEGYALGAVIDSQNINHVKKVKETIYPEFKGGYNYFNAGVLLLDTEKFRTQNITQQLVDLTIEKASTLTHPDQDILNIFFDSNFKILSYCYNYLASGYPNITQESVEKALFIRNTAKIIHFTGRKPWKKNNVDYNYKFWDTLKKTAFYEQVLFAFLELREKQLKTSLQKRFDTSLQKRFEILSQKQKFSYFRYYRYKMLRKITWGAWREKCNTKFQKLKKIKNS